MRCEERADSILEEKRRALQFGVELPVNKHASIKILLCGVAKIFVFGEHSLEKAIDILKILVGGFVMAIYFIFHRACPYGGRNTAHHVEEMRPGASVSTKEMLDL
jgi:hypothetical protein